VLIPTGHDSLRGANIEGGQLLEIPPALAATADIIVRDG
jgi:hypothetical protein